MSEATPLPDYFAGYLPLKEAVDRVSLVWRCTPEQTWGRLRPMLASGAIQSKLDMWEGPRDCDVGEWSDRANDKSYIDGHQGFRGSPGVRFPAFVSRRDLNSFLKEARLENPSTVDKSILTRLYHEASGPTAIVPLAPLLSALSEDDRNRFEIALVDSIRAGLFDDKKLEFLSEGTWTPLNAIEFKRIEAAFGVGMTRDVYILTAALPLAALKTWAAKFNISLPKRFYLEDGRSSELPSTASENRVAQTKEGAPSQRGAKRNVDAGAFWAEVERLVDEGLQADPRTAGHTVDAFTDAMVVWAKRGMQKAYERSTMRRYLEERWAALQERSRTRIN